MRVLIGPLEHAQGGRAGKGAAALREHEDDATPGHLHLRGGLRRATSIVLPQQTISVDFDADAPEQRVTHCRNFVRDGVLASRDLLPREEASLRERGQSRPVPGPGPLSAWARDLPVCFPDRPCRDYPPLEADAITVTSGLTPASQAIAVGCFIVLGVALVLVAVGSRPSRRAGPSLWAVALSTALIVAGAVIGSAVDLRFDAISSIYGPDAPGGADATALFGSWTLVLLAGEVMAVLGLVALVATATVAVVRGRSASGAAPAG